MPQNIVELYTPEELARLTKRVKAHLTALIVLALAALAACIALAVAAGTGNAEKMELAAVIISTLAGWVCIYDGVFIVGAGRKELAHANMLRSEPRTRVEGAVTVTAERFRIRSSVSVCRVHIETPDGGQDALVQEGHTRLLKDPRITAVYTAHGYVAAVEVGA